MNERIQELAYQAEVHADSVVDQGGEFHVAYTKKFAELIVQECVREMGRYEFIDVAIREVQEHFGVPE